MRRGLGVVKYCTPQGGSGFIANPALPWLSTFDITQQAPVYDQDMGWLRDSRPGTFTNYSRFGPPYSADGGIQSPFTGGVAMDDGGAAQPIPYDSSCAGGGIGDLILRRADVVAQLPSITGTARSGCPVLADPCASGLESWVRSNPLLAAGLALAGAFILVGGGRK
jgi:hypothetical protein